MIQAYIEGPLGTEAIKQKLIPEEKFYLELGRLASKLHQISCKTFGSPVDKSKQFNNHVHMQTRRTGEILDSLVKVKGLSSKTAATAKRRIEKEINLLAKDLHPVLIHGDMSPSNAIVGKDKKLHLIDWDNARIGIWPAEYIELSRRHLAEKLTSVKTVALEKNFYKGYGKKSLKPKQLTKLEGILMLIRQIWQMNYYYFDRKEKENFSKVRKLFYKILKTDQIGTA